MIRHGEDDEPLILHCFADQGVESEALATYGTVVRVGLHPRNTNGSHPIAGDAHVLQRVEDDDTEQRSADDLREYFPISEDVTFDLGVFHPVCTKWASTTSIDGDPDEHENMIPSARALAERYCDHHVIENVARAPLQDPTVLNGRMFGLPIAYERAFETSFRVPQPPRYKRFFTRDGEAETAETSSFYFSERSKRWWASVKQYSAAPYTKEHLAKNSIPAPYIHYVCRAWLEAYEDEQGLAEGRVDYSNYDEEMETMRRSTYNSKLDEFEEG